MTSGVEMVEGVAPLMGAWHAFSLACTAAAFMVDMYSLATFCMSTLHAHTHTYMSYCNYYIYRKCMPYYI